MSSPLPETPKGVVWKKATSCLSVLEDTRTRGNGFELKEVWLWKSSLVEQFENGTNNPREGVVSSPLLYMLKGRQRSVGDAWMALIPALGFYLLYGTRFWCPWRTLESCLFWIRNDLQMLQLDRRKNQGMACLPGCFSWLFGSSACHVGIQIMLLLPPPSSLLEGRVHVIWSGRHLLVRATC